MDSSFFIANRQALVKATRQSLLIFAAYTQLQEHNDVAFPFRQESNFFYLTGINEPDWLLIIDGKSHEEYLVAPNINETDKVFEGTGSHMAISEQSGVKNILPQRDLTVLLKKLATTHETVHTLGTHPWKEHFNFSLNPAQMVLDKIIKKYFKQMTDCRPILSKQRAIKQPTEIEQIRTAIDATRIAFESAVHILPSLKYEYEIEAEMTYSFRKQGLYHAYQPIVASGKNACTLHHHASGGLLQKDCAVLIDVGAQVNGYAADITRTFSYGRPSSRQQEIYDTLTRAHNKIIKLLKPGLSVKEYLEKSDEYMKAGLVALGLQEADYRTYFPHAISHGLGLDVHESLGGYDTFQPGMVLTVEPGIYISDEEIGMRIEDNILITKTGHENLSGAISTDFNVSSIIESNL